MKQTAIDWIEENMPNISKHIPLGLALEFTAKFQQAKELEKQQIIEAYTDGFSECLSHTNGKLLKTSEQYYKDNYTS